MLANSKDIEGCAIGATDGPIGHVRDLYFDDAAWVIRYLVVETGSWFSDRKVLISPIAIGRLNWTEKILPASVTMEQVKKSPDIDTEKPVSRQHEMNYLGYYNYPYYWGGGGFWGGSAYPGMLMTGYAGYGLVPGAVLPETQVDARADTHHQTEDPHLRSDRAIKGYHIHATDGDVGHVQGMLVDQDTWAIRYLIVDTSNWWLGHVVLIAPQWIDNVNWADATVSVNLTRQAVKDAPPYDAAVQLDRSQEAGIYRHYKRPGYWENEVRSAPAPLRH